MDIRQGVLDDTRSESLGHRGGAVAEQRERRRIGGQRVAVGGEAVGDGGHARVEALDRAGDAADRVGSRPERRHAQDVDGAEDALERLEVGPDADDRGRRGGHGLLRPVERRPEGLGRRRGIVERVGGPVQGRRERHQRRFDPVAGRIEAGVRVQQEAQAEDGDDEADDAVGDETLAQPGQTAAEVGRGGSGRRRQRRRCHGTGAGRRRPGPARRRTVASGHRSRVPLHDVADRGRGRLDVRRQLGCVLHERGRWFDQAFREDPSERVRPVCPPVDGDRSPRPDEAERLGRPERVQVEAATERRAPAPDRAAAPCRSVRRAGPSRRTGRCRRRSRPRPGRGPRSRAAAPSDRAAAGSRSGRPARHGPSPNRPWPARRPRSPARHRSRPPSSTDRTPRARTSARPGRGGATTARPGGPSAGGR